MSSFISFENVEKRYGTGEVSVQALHDASFIIEKGEICVIVGPSGAGKTTLRIEFVGISKEDNDKLAAGMMVIVKAQLK